jgi:hypothetical protein
MVVPGATCTPSSLGTFSVMPLHEPPTGWGPVATGFAVHAAQAIQRNHDFIGPPYRE